MAPTLLEIAEAPGAYVLPRHPAVVHRDGWLFMPMTPDFGAVQRVRLRPEGLEAARTEIRHLAAEKGLQEIGWFRSPLTEPQDIGERLGLELRETLAVLARTSPPKVEATHDVREVRTLDDYVTAQTIDATVHGWPTADRESHAEHWPAAAERFVMWVAYDEGRPVGMARCAVAGRAFVMVGGAVLPDARGRGIYRSLVAARWAAARERGLDALVTTANDQSGPILARLAFERLGEIEVWSDTQ